MALHPMFADDRPTLLIGMSGPPRSGKDTIGIALAAIIEDKHSIQPQLLALSTPMREVVYAMLGIEYSATHYDTHKDLPQDTFGGKSIRQAMIAFTEQHVKPSYGRGFWAKSLFGRMWEPRPRVLIVTDMGFEEEVEEFSERFGIENTFYPQITRPGCSFAGDSRSYVGPPRRRVSVINDGSIEDAAQKTYERVLERTGWDFS